MLDMGFWPAMKKIIGQTPKGRQTLLFSATIDHSITQNVGKLLNNPATVEIARRGETADTVEQYIINVQQAVKPALLKGVLSERGHKRVIVFTRTRSRADATCRRLKKAGYTVEAIHSSRSQNQRRRALDNFANGTTDILVATDVLARGIDVEGVDYVVNYDLPTQPEDYVHRIGRTGRAGHSGWAVSFSSPETIEALRGIEKLLKRSIPKLRLEHFDMQEAESEAAAKAQRAEARRDPEIQQAKKEEAARKRKKAKARSAEHAEEARSGRGRASGAAGKQGKAKSAAAAVKQGKAGGKQNSAQPKARKKPASNAGRQGGDFRPGRARRAALASQRSGKRR